jgi:hypothetical protein
LCCPQPGEARRGAQFPGFRLLPASNLDGPTKAGFRLQRVRWIATQPQLAVQPMQLRFVINDAGLADMVERFRDRAQPVLGAAGIATGLRQEAEPMRGFELGTGRAIGHEAGAQLGITFVGLPLLDQGPSAHYLCVGGQERETLLGCKPQEFFRHISRSFDFPPQLNQPRRPGEGDPLAERLNGCETSSAMAIACPLWCMASSG